MSQKQQSHNSFWDCIESERAEDSEIWETPNAKCDEIVIRKCTECGRHHVTEVWYDDDGYLLEYNNYGLEKPFNPDIESIVLDYDRIES